MLAATSDYEQDIIEEPEEEESVDVVAVNEEIRKVHQKSDENTTDITTNTTNVTTNTTNVATNTAAIAALQGIKGWVNFDGTTNTAGLCTIRDSYNVVSVTDLGTGWYRITWDTDFANDDYATLVTAQWGQIGTIYSTVGILVGSVEVFTGTTGGMAGDAETVCVMAIGDQ